MKNKAIEKIKEIATDVYKEIARLKSPSLIIPLRSLSNVMEKIRITLKRKASSC